MNEIANEVTVAYDYQDDDCDCAADCSDINVTEEESTWTKATIGYLLEECLKKKKDLHDPRHRRNKFFGVIREQMIARGFLFSAKTLEKKFHNLKKHFCTICQNRDRATTPGRPITWPYYEIMMEIFAEELEIEDAPTMASLYPDPPLPKNSIVGDQVLVTKIDPDSEPESQSDGCEVEPINEDDDASRETPWEHKSVVAFLRECAKRKYDLWDPQIRRRKIFTEIRQRLKAKGYNIFQESLDRKLRNMKKHFQVVTDAARRKDDSISRRRHITWPYYNMMKEIYGEAMEKEMSVRRSAGKKRPSLPPVKRHMPVTPATTTLKFRTIAPKSDEHANAGSIASQTPQKVQIIVARPAAGQIVTISKSGQQITTPMHHIKPRKVESSPPSPGEFDRPNVSSYSQDDDTSQPHVYEDDYQRKPINFEVKMHTEDKPNYIGEKLKFSLDIMELEERRTVVAEKMHEEFVESNRIKEKRLEFNRIKLEYTIARAKRKKNGSL